MCKEWRCDAYDQLFQEFLEGNPDATEEEAMSFAENNANDRMVENMAWRGEIF